MATDGEIEYAIIGGGIAGLCLGIALHHRDIKVRIYEAASHFGEIGAGVGFSPNAVAAMRVCHPGVYASYLEISQLDVGKKEFLFQCYNVEDTVGPLTNPTFELSFKDEVKAVHRAQFLDSLTKYFPMERVEFKKRLEKYQEMPDGSFTLHFQDGTTAGAQAIIGCDGIKSRVRRCLFGAEHPCVAPSYTHTYSYRALVPLDNAIAALGTERFDLPMFFFGPGGYVLTLAIPNYKVLNIVAFHVDPNEWPDSDHLTAPSTREAMLKDFEDFGPKIQKLLSSAKPELDKWAIFDLFENPPPSFAQGRVSIVGDAAHATSPHHGSGAGMCIEDAAVLSELLADERAKSYAGVEAAFAVYDSLRRPRGEMLVESSRLTGEAYEGKQKDLRRDWRAVASKIYERTDRIHNVNVQTLCEEATKMLGERLGC